MGVVYQKEEAKGRKLEYNEEWSGNRIPGNEAGMQSHNGMSPGLKPKNEVKTRPKPEPRKVDIPLP